MVEKYCQECPACQKTGGTRPPKVPLVPLLIVGHPFSGIALDIAGPFPRSREGYQFVLVIIDYATRFPKAVPLPSITAPKIAEDLLKWIAWVGIPQEILTDQGKNLNVKHPQGCMQDAANKTTTNICISSTD